MRKTTIETAKLCAAISLASLAPCSMAATPMDFKECKQRHFEELATLEARAASSGLSFQEALPFKEAASNAKRLGPAIEDPAAEMAAAKLRAADDAQAAADFKGQPAAKVFSLAAKADRLQGKFASCVAKIPRSKRVD